MTRKQSRQTQRSLEKALFGPGPKSVRVRQRKSPGAPQAVPCKDAPGLCGACGDDLQPCEEVWTCAWCMTDYRPMGVHAYPGGALLRQASTADMQRYFHDDTIDNQHGATDGTAYGFPGVMVTVESDVDAAAAQALPETFAVDEVYTVGPRVGQLTQHDHSGVWILYTWHKMGRKELFKCRDKADADKRIRRWLGIGARPPA